MLLLGTFLKPVKQCPKLSVAQLLEPAMHAEPSFKLKLVVGRSSRKHRADVHIVDASFKLSHALALPYTLGHVFAHSSCPTFRSDSTESESQSKVGMEAASLCSLAGPQQSNMVGASNDQTVTIRQNSILPKTGTPSLFQDVARGWCHYKACVSAHNGILSC